MEREGVRRAVGWGRRHATELAIVGFLLIVAWVASRLHHPGHTWGDDFALYLRQAKSLVDGNIGQVIGDNHFNVSASGTPAFSPYVYPWGFPMMLAPFYRAFGFDYLKLKMAMVFIFVLYLWFFHRLLRRRMQEWLAFGVVAAVGTSLVYLRHTDFLLSELPYMFTSVVALWWLDRCRRHGRIHHATRNELIVLGLLAMMVFNTRREGLAIVPAIAAVQLLDLRGRWRTVNWWRVATPLASFFASVILLQFMLPSALAPDYDNSGLGNTWSKLTGPWRHDFASELGINGLAGVWLLAIFLLVVAGLVLRLVTHLHDDLGIAVFALGSMTIVGLIPANSNRYLMSITPFAIYFGAQALAAIPLPRKAGPWFAVGMMALLVFHHTTQLPLAIRATDQTNASVATADGPESAYVQPAWSAVRKFTHVDDIVAFWRVRALTLYTDRRGVQSSTLDVVNQQADYFLMRKDSVFFQPLVTDDQAANLGWKNIWQDTKWVLWQVRQPRT
jgi:hypothetical protein